MFRYLIVIVVLLITEISGCTPLRRESGRAVVRQIGNVPCFSIEDTEKTRAGEAKLREVQVLGEQGEVWSASFSELSSLTPDQCIPYGQTNAVDPPLVPAQPLVPGQVYRVGIIAPMKDQYEAFGYGAEFCLLKHSGPGVRVHQIQMDVKAGRWMREVCEADAPK